MVEHAGDLRRIVSGGQTGVDRAALDLGRRTGTPIGGWCPAGGWAEDLTEPPGLLGIYPELRETASQDPLVRTGWNIRDSNATLVLVRQDVVSPGTEATVELVRQLARPHLVADVRDVATVAAWLTALPPGAVLNVAGPRESEAPGIHGEALTLLSTLLEPQVS